MRSSLLARVASVAAAAAIATTGATVAASAADASSAHHARRLPTHLSIAHRRAFEHHHRVTVIAGRLSTVRNISVPGRVVWLDRIGPKHHLTAVGHERTGRFGGVAFVVAPQHAAAYVLVFEGSRLFHSSHSRVVIVKD
ncbi:MAG TPA: hypothetical protein VMI33_01090 [Streptosporangiaceae bacterium]|nr:hypothetical protein [Streptosporangiaceae bacterium]